EITVTSGATEAIFDAIQAVVRRDDEVVVLDPCYDSYEPSVTLAGGRVVHLPLAPPEFAIDWDRLRDALNARTRLVIVNTPHNPAGTVLASRDLDTLAELLRPLDCYLLSDEVYEHVVFDGRAHATALAQAELRPRSIAVFSFGKTYHATGWKLGYAVAPPALADYMREHPEHHLGLPAFYEERRDYFNRLLADTKFGIRPSAGTYFQLADYGAISDLPDVEFARWLTIEHGVAVIPISVFYREPPAATLVRFCFAKEDATLEEAAR